MSYQYITENEELAQFCQEAASQPYVAIDTEFVRTRTFFPICGLIQANNGSQTVLIDPQAISDWSALVDLMQDPGVIKVLHSCSEDLEVFQKLLGTMPAPLFDTQFAATLLNLGNALGYAKLVEQLLGIQIDKGESRTDWLQRPLTDQQLSYAANDVVYLHQLYPMLQQQLQQQLRFDWVIQEGELMCERKRTQLPNEYRYLQAKNNWQLRQQRLEALKLLSQWRYDKAASKDLALNFVVREANLFEVCRKLPPDIAALAELRVLSGKEIRIYGKEIIALVKDAKATPVEACPDPVKRLVDITAYKKTSQALREGIAAVAGQSNIPIEILASKKLSNQFLKWLWFDLEECKIQGLLPDLMCGWRKQLLEPVLAPYLTKP